jgi:hypothetical protein
MKTKPSASTTSVALWQRVVQFSGNLSSAAARALLKFGFSEHDHARMEELATEARTGTLDSSEQTELETFERLGCLLDIVHSQARKALKKKPKRAS